MQNYPPSQIKARASAAKRPSPPDAAHTLMPHRQINRPTPQAEDDEQQYPLSGIGRSAIRYRTTAGDEVIQQGNKQLIIHHGKPPQKRLWLLYVGAGMLMMVFLSGLLSAFATWWTQHQIDSQYGTPRTWQVDKVVGHYDSQAHPTHFIFENLDTHVVIIEIPGGDISHARIYGGPVLFGDGANQLPVTADFRDVNGDNKIDMVVQVGAQTIVFFNNGTQFQPQL